MAVKRYAQTSITILQMPDKVPVLYFGAWQTSLVVEQPRDVYWIFYLDPLLIDPRSNIMATLSYGEEKVFLVPIKY
jgi:hypothetical protein